VTPAPGSALAAFGDAILGPGPAPGPEALRAILAAHTAEPRRYGFHATLKAPFRLQGEFDHADLLAEVRTFAAAVPTIPALEPAVGLIAGFVAIVPRTASPALDRVAADCVTAFDRFRLPMTAPERSRRLAAGLSPRQAAHLERWGYPFVFEEFRFHMTLTGRIAPDRRAAIHALLQDEFAKACGYGPIWLDRLALARQDRPDAPFRVIGHGPVSRAA